MARMAEERRIFEEAIDIIDPNMRVIQWAPGNIKYTFFFRKIEGGRIITCWNWPEEYFDRVKKYINEKYSEVCVEVVKYKIKIYLPN